ncbi:MAG: acyl carrier protein [Bryobacteraceae bacterium]|nr:acyl carrier protein [Bryobacteraceae bacterium]
MTREELLAKLDEILELPAGTLQGGEKLEDLEGWDSLAMMSYMAVVSEAFDRKLSPRQFVNCETVGDVVALALPSAAAS